MACRIGAEKALALGNSITCSAKRFSAGAPSASVKAITRPPRAAASCRLLAVFSKSGPEGQSAITGTLLSISAMGPCFISPAA